MPLPAELGNWIPAKSSSLTPEMRITGATATCRTGISFGSGVDGIDL
jgi:hypothetical protein